MTNKIAIDDGSSFIKTAFSSNNKIETIAFPSRVVNYAISDQTKESGFSSDSYAIDGQNYAVVKDGAESTHVMKTDTVAYQTSVINRVLVHHALRQTGIKGKVQVLVTLPANQFFKFDRSRNQELIDAKIANIKGDITYLDGTKKIEITDVFVMPEGLPAFQHALTTFNLSSGRYFIVDVGGTTSDLIDVQDGQIVKSDSLRIGSLEMINNFKSIIRQKINVADVSDSLALKGILEGSCFHQDFKEESAHIIETFRKAVFDKILTDNQHLQFDNVIFSGGGSVLLNVDNIHNSLKTEQPQFDNCLGGLAILESIED